MTNNHVLIKTFDIDGLELQFRPKDMSHKTLRVPFVYPDDHDTSGFPEDAWDVFFLDSTWSVAPIHREGMACTGAVDGHKLGDKPDGCDVCHEQVYNGPTTDCHHLHTICPDCVMEWACDYFFIIRLAGSVQSDWLALNGAPGYEAL